jgi:hypothetical protein
VDTGVGGLDEVPPVTPRGTGGDHARDGAPVLEVRRAGDDVLDIVALKAGVSQRIPRRCVDHLLERAVIDGPIVGLTDADNSDAVGHCTIVRSSFALFTVAVWGMDVRLRPRSGVRCIPGGDLHRTVS